MANPEPTMSSPQSKTEAPRPGTKSWWNSSVAEYKPAIAEDTNATNGRQHMVASGESDRYRSKVRIPYSVMCAKERRAVFVAETAGKGSVRCRLWRTCLITDCDVAEPKEAVEKL